MPSHTWKDTPAWKKANYPQMAIKRDYAPAKKDSGKATLTEVNGVKIVKGEDTGTVDGEWFKTQVSNLPKGIHLVDVRKADQFKEGNLKGSINVPLDSETSAIDSSKIPSEGIVVLYCNHRDDVYGCTGILAGTEI